MERHILIALPDHALSDRDFYVARWKFVVEQFNVGNVKRRKATTLMEEILRSPVFDIVNWDHSPFELALDFDGLFDVDSEFASIGRYLLADPVNEGRPKHFAQALVRVRYLNLLADALRVRREMLLELV